MPTPEVDLTRSADAPSTPSGTLRSSDVEAAPKTAPNRFAGGSRTMLGMPAPDAAAIRAAVDQARGEAKRQGGDAAVAPPAAERSPGAEPRLSPAPGLGLGPPAAAPPKKRALDPTTNRTMLGLPVPRPDVAGAEAAPPVQEPSPGRGRADVVYPADVGETEPSAHPPQRTLRGLALSVLALGIVVLLIGGGALLWTWLSSKSTLQASVTHREGAEALVVEVPGAPEGTRIRFHGMEEPLEAGVAHFPLSADDLVLGDNALSFDVIAPDGSVETHGLQLHLEMRVRADLGPLESVPPSIDVVVEAPPGSDASVDGEPLELDARGRGVRRIPVNGGSADAEGVVEHVTRYRIQPPEGESAQGELRTRIPLTTMQIDRPGEHFVTDRETVEVAGAAAPGSSVTVDGEEIELRMGRFLQNVALPTVGEHTVEVVARAAGKAPNVARIVVRRVDDLEAEAARFEHNEALTYARIAQNPNTYRGQRVAFEGLVYNVEVRNGRSVIQILVRDCPAGERCPLWVTYAAATEAEMRSRVRVLGTVAGEQQFRAQSGQIRTVPRVDATYVLPDASSYRR